MPVLGVHEFLQAQTDGKRVFDWSAQPERDQWHAPMPPHVVFFTSYVSLCGAQQIDTYLTAWPRLTVYSAPAYQNPDSRTHKRESL